MRVAVSGATGTVGRALVRALRARGDEAVALSRDAGRARALLDGVEAFSWPAPKRERPPLTALRGADAFVHLLGEPLAQRWTGAAKAEIRDSRVHSTANLVAALGDLAEPPRTLVSQSATGWYGPRGEERLEESEPPGEGFLASVTREWEESAREAERLGVRVTRARAGVVLSRSGGALEKMLPPFRLGLGGPVAGGGQYVPWIDLGDVVGALLFCLDTDAANGPINVTAPEPVTNKELASALGRALRRPAVLPVPGFALSLLYGEMASVVTTGQRAVPARLLGLGYRFKSPDLQQALRAAVATG